MQMSVTVTQQSAIKGKGVRNIQKISVIIPCYNVGYYIDRCLTSIMVQTIGSENLEIICIDDASTDDTWEHLQLWEQLYPEQILLLRQQMNGRQGKARNIGLSYASANWVAFADADDWLEPDYFKRLYDAAMRHECDVAACGVRTDFSRTLSYFDEECRQWMDDQYFVADSQEKIGVLFERRLLCEGPVAKLIRKKLLTEHDILFAEDVAYEDHYWLPLLYIYTKKIYVTGKNLYHYFVNPDSTSHSRNKAYHMDWITVHLMKWAEYERRGLWQEYRELLEGDALYDAAGFVRMLVLGYDEPSYSCFLLMSELIRRQIPAYEANPYAAKFPELYRQLLKALYVPADKEVFCKIAEALRTIYF